MRIGEYPKLLYLGGDPTQETRDAWNAEDEAKGNALGFFQFRPGHEVPHGVPQQETKTPKARVKRRDNRNRDNQ